MQVLTRYGLQKLFGPENANVTSNDTILYPDLPSNMVLLYLYFSHTLICYCGVSNSFILKRVKLQLIIQYASHFVIGKPLVQILGANLHIVLVFCA